MEKEIYTLHTDASFDDVTKTAVYSIVIMQENIVIKTIAKKCRIQINNSTECEIFAIYQAVNVILSSYIKKDKIQKFIIKTDCVSAKDFFTEKKKKINVFQNEKELSSAMKELYNKLYTKLSKKGCSFIINWCEREKNKTAHKCAYSMLQKLKLVSYKNDFLVMDKNLFIQIISNYNENQCKVLCYLIKEANEQKIICKTQKEIAETLNISSSLINKIFKELINLNMLEKVSNGKYALGI